MTLRLISTAVGYNTRKGDFAALVHRLKFEDGSTLLTSWGADAAAQLISALTILISAVDCSESAEAEKLFKSREGKLSHQDIEAPGVNSIVSAVRGAVENNKLSLQLVFRKSGITKNFQVGHDDARSLMGYTGNALQQAGVLDQVMMTGSQLLDPIILFTCKVQGGGVLQHQSFAPVNQERYNFLPFLYLVVIIDNALPGKPQVVGGFFVKSAYNYQRQEFQALIYQTLSVTPDFNKLPTGSLSFRSARIIVPDDNPLTEQEYLREFSKSYMLHSISGNA